jgi:hypothetical protein
MDGSYINTVGDRLDIQRSKKKIAMIISGFGGFRITETSFGFGGFVFLIDNNGTKMNQILEGSKSFKF